MVEGTQLLSMPRGLVALRIVRKPQRQLIIIENRKVAPRILWHTDPVLPCSTPRVKMQLLIRRDGDISLQCQDNRRYKAYLNRYLEEDTSFDP